MMTTAELMRSRGLAVAGILIGLACAGCGGSQPAQIARNARLSGNVKVCHIRLMNCSPAAATVIVFTVHGKTFGGAVAQQYAAHGRFSFTLAPGKYFPSASVVRPPLDGRDCISGEAVLYAREDHVDGVVCFIRATRR
jgi:hypothetical protein